MTQKSQIIILVLLFFLLITVINAVRKRTIELKYALAWFFGDIALMLIVLFPKILNILSNLLGIYSPVNMIFFLGFLFSLMLILILTITLSRVTARIRRLAQIEAIEMWDLVNESEDK